MVYDKSKENLDRLLQVGGGFGSSTSSRRRTSQPPRPDGASILVERARASEGHESCKLPDPAHPFCTSILVGQAWA
jgi:hypothetical protein